VNLLIRDLVPGFPSALQNEHRSSVLKPILCNFELVCKIELSTLN